MNQNKTTNPFYASRAWRRKRRVILLRDRHLCQACLRKGRIAKADTVHHKRTFEARPDLALVDGNLESLCRACHEEAHSHRKNIKAIPEGVRVIKA